MLRQIFMLADKSIPREAMLLFRDEDIAFLGHTKWSTKQSGNNQRGTVKDTRSQVKFLKLWTYQPPSPFYLSLSARRSWYTSIVHPVLTSRVYCFFVFLFIQILIDLYPLSKEEFNKNSSGSHFEYSLVECTHVLSPMIPDKCSIDEGLLQTTLCFPVTAQHDWFMCIPLGQRKTFL